MGATANLQAGPLFCTLSAVLSQPIAVALDSSSPLDCRLYPRVLRRLWQPPMHSLKVYLTLELACHVIATHAVLVIEVLLLRARTVHWVCPLQEDSE